MEVALALAIVSFALIPIVGLLAGGFLQSRSNADRMVEVQIMDWVRATAKAALTEDGSLDAIDGREDAFDRSGIHIPSGAGGPEAVFSTRLRLSSKSLPGSSQSLSGVTTEIRIPARGDQILATNVFWLEK